MVEGAILLTFGRNCCLWSVKSKSIPCTFVGIVCACWRNKGRSWRIFTKWIAQFRRLSSRSVPLPVPTPSSNQLSNSQEQATKRVALEDFGASVTSVDIEEDNSTLPNRTLIDQWPSMLTSTPCKEKNHPVPFAVVVPPVSPIPAREPEEKKTRVQATVEWPSQTKVNTLHEGLESLGKMLCCGTYKQIAGAVWKNPILRKYMQQLYLEEVDRECTAMCSRMKNRSCLRSPSKKDLQSFSFRKFNSKLESKAPLFSAVLWTASVRKSKRDDEFWLPSVCMSVAVLLKNRSPPCMNAMQLINTIILYHSGIIVSNFFNQFVSDVFLVFYCPNLL